MAPKMLRNPSESEPKTIKIHITNLESIKWETRSQKRETGIQKIDTGSWKRDTGMQKMDAKSRGPGIEEPRPGRKPVPGEALKMKPGRARGPIY